MSLFFNPATNIIFGSDDPQSGDIESISNIRAAELVANGATVDESANELLGKSDSSGGATADVAPDAPAPDASASTSDTADAVPLADGGAGEQGNADAAVTGSPTVTAAPDAASEPQESTESATAEGNVNSGTGTAASASDTSATANDSASTDSASQTSTDAGTGSNSSPSVTAGDPGVIVPVADAVPSDEPQLAAADKVDATVEDQSGNVVAGGAPLAATTSRSTNDAPAIPPAVVEAPSSAAEVPQADPNSDEHPVKTRARWLRTKIEAEEAIVMSQLIAVLRDIEEAL